MEERKYDKIVGLLATILLVVILNIPVGETKFLEGFLTNYPDMDPKKAAKNISYGVLFLGWVLRAQIGFVILTKLYKK